MFPITRPGKVLLACAALIFALALALPPVSFRITDLGVRTNGTSLSLVGNGTAHHRDANATALHFTACNFVGSHGVCVHKELSWDRAHGLHLAFEMTSRQSNEI